MGIIDNVKEIVKIVQKADNIELYRKVIDLESEVLELTKQLKDKEDTISKLNEAMAVKGKMICEGSVYYIVDDAGNKKDGPFCTKCYDIDHVMCRIIQPHRVGEGRSWEWIQCQRCKVPFRSKEAGVYLNTH